jgi:hypothetical protein
VRHRAWYLRKRLRAGKQITAADRAWLDTYEQRPVARAWARRRRLGRVEPHAIPRAAAKVYGLRGDCRRWRCAGASAFEAWRQVVVAMLRVGIDHKTIGITVGMRSNCVNRTVRRWEAMVEKDPQLAERLDQIIASAVGGAASFMAAVQGVELAMRRDRAVVRFEVAIDSPLWRAIDVWAEAQEHAGVGAPVVLRGAE